jgi:hypothetical protein
MCAAERARRLAEEADPLVREEWERIVAEAPVSLVQ